MAMPPKALWILSPMGKNSLTPVSTRCSPAAPILELIAFEETDEWAHQGRYDFYLLAARKMDDYVKTLWESVQATPEYRDKTTFLITCDHGRGSGPKDWQRHGANVEGAENIWL